jgi:MFS family permease
VERPLHRNGEYVALWVGQTVSALGISISSFAYPLVVLAATGSPAKAGLVGSVLAGTTFFLRLPAGALVDRWNRKAILVVCDLGRALSAGALALTLALGHFFFVQVLVVAFLEGAFGVLFGPAEAAAVKRVVAPTQVRDAVARNQSRMQLAGLVGPPVGGVLLGVGRALPFVADAVSYLVSLVGVLFVRSSLQDPPEPRPRRCIGAEVLDGVRWLWRRPFFRGVLVWMTLEGAAFSSVGLVILVLARERGASSAQLGAMFAITSAGGVLGALATPWLLRHASPRALMLAFAWIGAAATLALRGVESPYAMGVLGAAAFFLSPSLSGFLFAAIAERCPDRLLGRANSAAIQLASLASPVAPLIAGALLGLVGAPTTVVIYAGWMLVLAAAATLARGVGAEPAPAPA